MADIVEDVRARLFAMQDLGYRAFHSKLMPTVPPENVIGVRTPEIRKLARQMSQTPEAEAYLQRLPHRYYEENNLHGARSDGRGAGGVPAARGQLGHLRPDEPPGFPETPGAAARTGPALDGL